MGANSHASALCRNSLFIQHHYTDFSGACSGSGVHWGMSKNKTVFVLKLLWSVERQTQDLTISLKVRCSVMFLDPGPSCNPTGSYVIRPREKFCLLVEDRRVGAPVSLEGVTGGRIRGGEVSCGGRITGGETSKE